MRVVFMGTPLFAVWTLEALLEEHQVVAVFTPPDSVSGRGKLLRPSPVKEIALARAIQVETPSSFYLRDSNGLRRRAVDGEPLVDAAIIDYLAALEPDFIIVAAYGLILPSSVLEIPRYGCINVHASLLPRWRGAAPIQRALLAGDEYLGVSIMRMEEGLDTGDYCAVAKTRVDEKHLAELTDELGQMGASLLLDSLPRIATGSVKWTSQDAAFASYANKIAKNELWLSTQLSAQLNLRRVQASSEQAPARCLICSRPVTVLAARVATDVDALPRTIDMSADRYAVMLIDKRLFLQTTDGWLEVLTVKPDGKKKMTAAAFAAGVKVLQAGNGHLEAVWRSC